MNYRHAYHAGNFADVFKHVVLVALTQALLRKDTAFCYVDTHAGAGSYDLSSIAAQKTKEAALGIGKIIAQPNPPALVQDYLRCVSPEIYPGSPLIVRQLLRAQDRMVLSELHPEELAQLRKVFRDDKLVAVHLQDGYQSLKAFLPPKERRGLVLIDPPYEKTDEFEQLAKTLPMAVERWETGVFALWYPLKNRAVVERFQRTMQDRIARPLLFAELSIYAEDSAMSLNGSGMMIINPPWKLAEELQDVLPWLWKVMSVEKQGRFRVF